MADRSVVAWSGWAGAAIGWCAVFAGVHLFWVAGGSIGLASSAGRDLADRRPAAFVVFGLGGVAALLLVGVALVVVASGAAGSRRLTRAARLIMVVVGVGLLIRGVAMEVLLAADVGGLRDSVGQLETRWSLALWNPWFALGGALFLSASLRAAQRQHRADTAR